MRNFQQNLLIVLALGLCGLCAWQWCEQAAQRSEITTLNHAVYEKALAIQSQTNSIATLTAQLAQMDSRISELTAAAKTNADNAETQRREIARLQASNLVLTNEIADYRKGVDKLEQKLKEAYDGIAKQNEAIKELVAQRDEFVKKYNDSVKDRNDIVAKYNDLAAQVRKLESNGGK